MQYKVVLTEHVYPDLELETNGLSEAGAELVHLDTKDERLIAAAVRDADAVITCYANISADIIRGMTKCRSISRTGIGVNNIDIAQATKQGICVMNVPDHCIEEVSDTAVALILSFTRRIPFLLDNVRGGSWSMDGCEDIARIKGKTLGLLGFGRISRRVAEKMKPFGVKLLAFDPYVTQDAGAEIGVKLVSMDEVLTEADILSLHLPLTRETEGVINRDTLKIMKPSALLINTSRGPLVNEPDLYAALSAGELAGAGLDVICDEKYDKANPLFAMPNVLITPHAAYYSLEALQEMREKILADILAVLADKQPKYQVNKIEP